MTLCPNCNSCYLGANVAGKLPPSIEKCNEVAAKGYEGFALG